MKTIHRYVLKEMASSFLLCVALLTALFMTNRGFLLLDLILSKKASIFETALLYLCLLPFILSMTVPMSMMVGTLLAFGRLSSDMEVTACKSSGVHMFQLISPILALGALMTGLMLFFNDKVLPAANFAFKKTEFQIIQKQADLAIREKVFIDRFEGYQFYIDRQERDGSFSNITVFKNWSSKATVQTTLAKTGVLETNQKTYQVFFHLNDGVMYWDNQNYQTYNQLYFDRYTIRLPLESQLDRMADIKKDYEQMDLKELSEAIPKEKDPGRYHYMTTEYQKRLALPFACLALVWFCAPLGLWTKTKGFMGFVLGLALIFLYYLMFILGQTLSTQGWINPMPGLWWPDIVLAAAGCLIYYLVVAEHSAFRFSPSRVPAKSRAGKAAP